jgi:hypothetical protein
MKKIKTIIAVILSSFILLFTPHSAYAHSYSEIFNSMSDYDYQILAQMLYQEARGESFEGQLATAEVTLNRVLSNNYPNSVHEVILQPGEYSTRKSLSKTIPLQMQWDVIEYIKNNGNTILDIDYVYFSTHKQSYATGYIKINHQWFGKEK